MLSSCATLFGYLSGQLYFADASLTDLSAGTNIDISYTSEYNIISLSKDLTDISSITLDSSLIFQSQDGSAITLVAPSNVS